VPENSNDQYAGDSAVNTRILMPAELAAIFGEVRTERLVLRRLQSGDGPAMFAIHGDPETFRYSPRSPDPDLSTSEKDLRRWLRGWENDGYGYWAVTLPGKLDVIGFGGISRFVFRDRNALNLYYRFTPAAWNHGYASEMARTAVTLARTHLPQLPVVARTRPANIASIRTAEKAGLQRRPDLDTEHIVLALGWT
jgi:ribosomal-protein-alanine N-acetyltransferase